MVPGTQTVATTILQATPIIVVLGAMVFFGETVGRLRWCAIVAGALFSL